MIGERGTARAYMDPYLAGVGIGVVLLLGFILVGRGIGASGAFSAWVASGMAAVAPAHVAGNVAYAAYAPDGPRSLLSDWLVWELFGVVLGGLASACLSGRFRRETEHGPGITSRSRLVVGLAGGLVMGVGAKLARGCTSGQALSGGAMLAVGSWIFIVAAFAAAYLVAPALRRLWT